MNWRRSAIGVSIALPMIALLWFGMTQDPKAIASPLPGKPAPLFDLKSMDGEAVSLEKLKGNVVVLNFWASWCLECRYEHTALSETATAYKDRGVKFYGVLYTDTPDNGREWIKMMGGQSYPTLLDPQSRTAIDFGLYGVPETFFIDQTGKVVEKKIGPVTPEYLRQVLENMLKNSATAL
jgi:cytochrome c biogenesis protein CcmG/thiol:disulfide interchange protein DsbE